MRQRLAEVAESARDQMLEWHDALQSQNGLSDEEVARRYATQHKGNPRAVLQFVKRAAPDQDPFEAAVEYERTMEDLLRRQRRNNAT